MRRCCAALTFAALLWPLAARAQALPFAASASASASASAASAAAAGSQAPADRTQEVRIQDYQYSPAVLAIKAGTTVRWLNLEKRVSHSILFSGAQGFESDRIFPGESWQRRFNTPGSFVYSCGPHPEMKGRIDVSP